MLDVDTHTLKLVELTPDEIREWLDGWADVADDRLPTVRRVVCTCGWRSRPSSRLGTTVWGSGYVHRLASGAAGK